MKYTKERQFVKAINEILEEEVIVSRIEIIQSSYNEEKELYQVIYKDRFGNKYSVDNIADVPVKRRLYEIDNWELKK